MERSTKLARIVLWVIMIISIVLCVALFTTIENQQNPGVRAEQLISIDINWAIFLTAIAALIAITFAVIQIIGDKKKAISTLVILVGFALIIVIAYLLSSSDYPKFFGVEKFIADGTLTPSISRWIGTGLVTLYILIAGATLSVVGFSVAGLFKRS